MSSQNEKAERFRALHAAPETFVIANAWDAGSARILTALGFKALAASSGARAGVLGQRDGMVTREEALAHCQAIADVTDCPVSADLEKASAMRRRPPRKLSVSPPVSGLSAARSRMRPVIRPVLCTTPPMETALPPIPLF